MLGTEKILAQINNNQVDYEQQTQSQKLKTAHSVKKQPSKIGILILFIVTIVLYAFSIGELSKTVTGVIEATVQDTTQDYRF